MKSKLFPLFRVSSITLAAAFSLGTAYASPISWDGSDSTAWALGTNWTGDAAPANDLTLDIAVFNLASYTTPVFAPNAGTTSISGIKIGDDTTSTGILTLSGTLLSIGGSGIDMRANAGATTVSSPVTLGAAQTWQNASSNLLTVSSAVTGGGNLLTVGGAGNTTISAAIGGTGALVKEGAGTLTLGSTANPYSGGTTVNGGTLTVNTGGGAGSIRGALAINSGALVNASTSWSFGFNGDSTAVTTIAINGGTLNFTGALNNGGTSASSITMTGGTISGTGFDWYNGSAVTRTLTTLASSTSATLSSGINIRLNSGGMLKFDVADGAADVDLLVSGVLRYSAGQAGAGVTKDGAGRTVLSATNTYTGATTVTNGSLLLNAGSLHTSSAVAVASTATFGGKGSAGAVSVTGGTIQGGYADVGNLSLTSLSFTGSSTLNLMPVTGPTASVAVSGAVTTSGTQTLNITSSNPLGVGSFRLVSWGSIAGSGTGAFVLGSTPVTPGTARPRSYALDITPTDYVGLNVTGDAPVWTGNTNGVWDTTTANNWVLASDGITPTTYYSADAVQFNDTTGNRNITISGPDVTPASVSFNNGTGNDYTLGGSNGIGGSASLTKSGAGALTITNTNTYTGSSTINAGTLEIGGSGKLGNGNYAGAITNNAALVYSSSSDQTLSGGISGSGTLMKSGAATLTLSGTNSYTGATTISGGTVSATGMSSGSALTLSGGSTLNLTAGATLANSVTIASGQTGTLKQSGAFSSSLTGNYSGVVGTLTLDVSGGNNTGISPNSENGPALGSVVNVIGAGGENQVYCNPNGDAAQTFFANAKVVVTGGVSGTTHFFLGNVSNNRNVQFGALDGGSAATLIDSDNRQTTVTVNGVADGNFAGVIANGSGGTITFVKTGSATQTLSGASTYSGTTTVNAGKLVVANTTGSATGSGAVTVKSAATLAGTGSIGGATTIENGGLIAPGVSGIGTLTVASAAMSGIYQCDLGTSTSDLLAVTGTLTVGGTTSIAFSGTPTANSYTIASYGTLSGTLPAITPPSGYSLVDDSANKQIKLVKVAAGYDSWMAAWVTAGFTGDTAVGADPDADGMKNLLEFVLNGNPGASDTTVLPVQQVTATDLVFSFTRRVDSATGTTQVFEYGSNLSGWTPVNITGTPGAEVAIGAATGTAPNEVQTITVTIPRSAAVNGKLFGRLTVTQP